MTNSQDRLYDLLPLIYRQRDEERGGPLRGLLRVIAEQVGVVEADIEQLYENWFIETAQDWAVPYIADLIGWTPANDAGQAGAAGAALNKALVSRRDVANTIRYRRRKGTLALLELLANDVAGWPARAIEFYQLLAVAQNINHQRLQRGQTVDVRLGGALDCLNGPFDELAHNVDVRAINSKLTRGFHNIPSVGLFVWRLKNYPVTMCVAKDREERGANCFTFSVLGNDMPLYINPQPETDPTHIAEELNLPAPIRRRALEDDLKLGKDSRFYGEGKSFVLWENDPFSDNVPNPISPERLVVADLTKWHYHPPAGGNRIAIDPVLGRIVFPTRRAPKKGLWVSYQYAFSTDMGGGEYARSVSQPVRSKLYRVGRRQSYTTITAALDQWRKDVKDDEINPTHAVIEITDSGVYSDPIDVDIPAGHSLQIRAANHQRPVLYLTDRHTAQSDNLFVSGRKGSRFILDGVLVWGRGVQVQLSEESGESLASFTLRHCTLVPGWGLKENCDPLQSGQVSMTLLNVRTNVKIEHSILGPIQVNLDAVHSDPLTLHIRDSIVDAMGSETDAIGSVDWTVAHVVLNIARTTILGKVGVHAITLAENSIFTENLLVQNRQRGCIRFCYFPIGSCVPRRYHCQPDLVIAAAEAEVDAFLKRKVESGEMTADEASQFRESYVKAAQEREKARVHPRFNSVRYGHPAYCQLADSCAEEIKRGAEDESELGVFHDLYQPQRAANLRAHLNEFTPVSMSADLIYAS